MYSISLNIHTWYFRGTYLNNFIIFLVTDVHAGMSEYPRLWGCEAVQLWGCDRLYESVVVINGMAYLGFYFGGGGG